MRQIKLDFSWNSENPVKIWNIAQPPPAKNENCSLRRKSALSHLKIFMEVPNMLWKAAQRRRKNDARTVGHLGVNISMVGVSDTTWNSSSFYIFPFPLHIRSILIIQQAKYRLRENVPTYFKWCYSHPTLSDGHSAHSFSTPCRL